MEGPSFDVSFLPLYVQIIILVISLIAVAFFSSSEASLISANKVRIRYLAENGNKSAKTVNSVINRHEKFFAAILLTENAFIIFASIMGAQVAMSLFGDHSTGIFFATFIMTVLIVQFGEIIPKTLAAHAAERWALIVSRPIALVMVLETHVIYLFTLLPRLLLKMMGGKKGLWTPSVTEGELRMLIDIGKLEGTVDIKEAEMLEKVFHFGDREIREVMTARTEIVWLAKGTTLKEFLVIYAHHNHTRFPIFEDMEDNVIGIISSKDVLNSIASGQSKETDSITRLLRPIQLVPETNTVANLFSELRRHGHQMAMVVDEFGGIAGLVTMKKLLEVIVGPVGEEGMPLEERYSTISENTYQIEGAMPLLEANEKLCLQLPEGNYHTLAGFVLEYLKHIPYEGERFRYRSVSFKVREMRGVKIEKLDVRRRPSKSGGLG